MALSFHWLREIKEELKTRNTIPLTSAPPFPWDELASHLAHTFECSHLEIVPKELTWRAKDELLDDLNQPLSAVNFTISPLKGQLCWVVSEAEVNLLASLLLTKESNPLTIQDQSFKESFYRYLILETLHAISQTSFEPSLVPMLTEQDHLPSEDSLCLDINFSIDQRTFWGRLIISSVLRKSMACYFSQREISHSAQELAKTVEIPLHLEIGQVQLPLAEWKKVSLGDFIILDRCSLHAPDFDGEVMLTVHGKPAFKGEIEGDHVKIIEFPSYYKEDTYMTKNDEDELNDFDYEDDEEKDEDEDLDEFDEFDEELFDDLEEEEHEALEEEKEDETSEQPAETVEEVESLEESEASAESEELEEGEKPVFQMTGKGPLTPDQIPLSIVVELGTIQMTMDKLLQIEPGNLLDISVQPENSVDLTVNGRVIAKGELVRIGENLSVRVVELGYT